MQKYLVTEVHRVAGRLDKEARVVELDGLPTADGRKGIAKILRKARLLCPGQSIRSVRHVRDCWLEFVVFPNNAPAGTHSLIFKAVFDTEVV